MRQLLILGLLIITGCTSTVSPLEPRRADRADDPFLTTQEQRSRVRSMFAYPDDEFAPRSGAGEPRILYYPR